EKERKERDARRAAREEALREEQVQQQQQQAAGEKRRADAPLSAEVVPASKKARASEERVSQDAEVMVR
ncbi:hypothetical protein LTS18_013286, partial [Coniosporium uncinatum]